MQPIPASAMQDLIGRFRAYLTSERMLRPVTVKRYNSVIESFSSFLASEQGSALSLEAVKKESLGRFLRTNATHAGEPSKPVFNSRLAALRSFYQWLFKEEVID